MQRKHQNKRRSKDRTTLAIKSPRKLRFQNSMLFAACGMLLILGIAIINVPNIEQASACSEDDSNCITANSNGDPMTMAASVKTGTYVYSTLSMALDDAVNMEIVPKSGGAFVSGSSKLTITTNNTSGYAVYLQTSDNSSELKNANGAINASINPTTSLTSNNYKEHLNTWGYTIGSNDTYEAIPKSGDAAIITTDQTSASDSYDLNFGVAVGADLPAGQYYNSVLVSVVANPIAVHTLSGITYMQEMSPYVCDYSDENETTRLIDTRDGKSYWVAKLADGNCWMTQNLALDIVNQDGVAYAKKSDGTVGDTLNSGNTNITSDSVDLESTITESKLTFPDKITINSLIDNYSWNMGDYVLATPMNNTACANIEEGKGFEQCSMFWKVDPEYKVSTQANFSQIGTWNGSPAGPDGTAGIVTVDKTNKIYDAHYLIGNFYKWSTAIAGKDGKTTADDITSGKDINYSSSICPKNWRLPRAGTTYIGADGITHLNDGNEFTYMLHKVYGYRINGDWIDFPTATSQELTEAPLHLVRSGIVRITEKYINNAGSQGDVWSSTGHNNDNGTFTQEYLMLGKTFVHTSHYLSWNNGTGSIRCIAE